MDDEQGPWWTQPPEPRSEPDSPKRTEPRRAGTRPAGSAGQQERASEQLEHPGLKLDVDRGSAPAQAPPSPHSLPPALPHPPKPRWTVAPGVDVGLGPDDPEADPGADTRPDLKPDSRPDLKPDPGPDSRPDRRKPQSEARTETLPAVPDDIFATFTPADPDGIITGPIPSQPFGESHTSVAVPQLSGAPPERPKRPLADPRMVLIGGAGLLVVAVIVLLAMLSGGDIGGSANQTPNSVTAKRTGVAAAAASFGGQVPSGLARVGAGKAAAILVKAGQKGSGEVNEAWTWKDKNGTNLVVSTVQTLPGKHAKLQVIHVAHVESDSPKPLRIMTEPSLPTCRAGGTAQFTKSLLVRDLNKDDVAEIAAGWSSHCGSQKSSEVKLALITGGHKYIIRGKGVIGGKPGRADPDPKPAGWPDGFFPALQAVFHKLYY